ncbi:MAG: GNAT family N-acetyltransferase [Pseudonocardiaceae bacterium]|nr:GNAT family N-acetyltransferase [Pseudonocardiaceae bacterium]
MGPELRTAAGDQLGAAELYALLRLRCAVFVVEQNVPYQELDGRDLEPSTRHLWLSERGTVLSCLRVLAEPGGERRIGRVATAESARGVGLAARLMGAAVDEFGEQDCVLDAQVYVQEFYARFGFTSEGDEFDEDGIPHITMRRPAGRSG